MNSEVFVSMQRQMAPTQEVRAALSEKLTYSTKRRITSMKHRALVACAVLAIVAVPFFWLIPIGSDTPTMHSYTLADDQLNQANSSGKAMDGVEANAQSGTGSLGGGLYVGDAPAQEAASNAYRKLMNQFGDVYPDWYGGAYIDGDEMLTVLLVTDKDPGDGSLENQVMEWTDNGPLIFLRVQYSYRYLLELQEQTVEAMMEQGILAGCGVDEKLNRLGLLLTDVTDDALSILDALDPAGDAIWIEVVQQATFADGTECPAANENITDD